VTTNKSNNLQKKPLELLSNAAIANNCHTSSSLSNMFGIPFVIGNFRPVSGQTRKPSFTSICKRTAHNLLASWKTPDWQRSVHSIWACKQWYKCGYTT